MHGLFVVVEGPDGAGKTTLAQGLARRARSAGLEVLEVREPGGTETAEAARALVWDPARDWTAVGELFLVLAARAELVEKVLRPQLARGSVIIGDRFDLSTEAYQVAGRGLLSSDVLAANRLATGGLRPDLTFVLDVPPAVGRERQLAQGKRPDRMELEDSALHERVARFYLDAGGSDVVHLDATQPPGAVEEAAWGKLRARLRGTEEGAMGSTDS